MAATARAFPALCPSSRSYKPGSQPQTKFRSQNGSLTLVQFGYLFVDAELDMQFRNITDERAGQILDHYLEVQGDDYVTFDATGALDGMGVEIVNRMETGRQALRWRYDGPPQITSVYPGVSTVSCKFIGYLYGS